MVFRILGSNSALPCHGRYPSSFLLEILNHQILIDCGEGCQSQGRKFKFPIDKISIICISHMHGDHIFGLPGLISSFCLNQRKNKLIIIGPVGVQAFVHQNLKSSFTHQTFPIEYIENDITTLESVFSTSDYSISCFPLEHKIPTRGYLIEEKRDKKNVRKELVSLYNLNPNQIKDLLADMPIHFGNKMIEPSEIIYRKNSRKSIAYCSDSRFIADLSKFIQSPSLLYHEATYMHTQHEMAYERGHSTAFQAGIAAKNVQAERLLIGHPSSKYKDVEPLVVEARSIFLNTHFALEGSEWII